MVRLSLSCYLFDDQDETNRDKANDKDKADNEDGANFYDCKYKSTSIKIVGKLIERIRKLEGWRPTLK